MNGKRTIKVLHLTAVIIITIIIIIIIIIIPNNDKIKIPNNI